MQVGEHVVYADAEQVVDDLFEALEIATASGRLHPGFGQLRIVLSRSAQDLHTVAELRLDEEVARGESELVVELVSRIESLRIDRDETPVQHRDRVQAFVEGGGLEAPREHAETLAQGLAHALSVALDGATPQHEPTELRLIAPGPVQVARFRLLSFGRQLRAPSYRALTSGHRSPAYDHPHVHHFFDPYHDLTCWAILGAVVAGRCPTKGIWVLDPEGRQLFTTDAVPEAPRLPVALDAVTITDEGITVDDAIEPEGLDAAEAGGPHTPGYGGEDYGE